MRVGGERKREEGGREDQIFRVIREGWEVYELVFITTLVQSRYVYFSMLSTAAVHWRSGRTVCS